MQDLEIEIRDLIAEIIEKEPKEITPDAKFFEDLGVDSMMALEILAAVEKKYRIHIPEEKLTQLVTLRQTVAVAREFLGQKGQDA
jgi:acyl carrier protein